MNESIHAEIRPSDAPRGQLRKLRKEGKVPGVLYGKERASSPLMVDEKELQALLKGGTARIVQMKLGEKDDIPVMVGDVQRDALTRSILHVDFRQVNMNDPITAHVRVEIVGEPKASKSEYLLHVQKTEVEVRCLPENLPSVIHADISGLHIGNGLTAGHLTLPDGVELEDDPSEVIAVVMAVKKPLDEDEAEGVHDAATGEAPKTQKASDTPVKS
jgi:large subunit ribosomal protein L25